MSSKAGSCRVVANGSSTSVMANAPAQVAAMSVSVKFRSDVDGSEQRRQWGDIDVAGLLAAASWRTFRWHHGQKHYSAPTGLPPQEITSSMSPGSSWRVCCPRSSRTARAVDASRSRGGGRPYVHSTPAGL